ncbi:prolyl oligopeptidase [Sphingopyxis sp. OAS728]|uniref:prolyl oligopeptidase family serine peptidase n=1 Tax=Sphingopyxis sp. OAS728 TaxID=2663823 RepID=UPI00178AA305|nr:prolyl oligopeptidase family serine peptidase [Sphingopyxis sp. OAS728]MBE1529927.1 prolyl oligopeptidase [Sphingopyxis sp. OAS728]
MTAPLSYPQTEQRPETVAFGAVRYNDPYRWLEEDRDPAVAEWQRAQDALTQDYLAALPAAQDFARRIAEIGETDDVTIPMFAGGRWFRRYVPEDRDLAVVDICDNPAGPGRRLIDLNAMRTDEPLSIGNFIPSPDGRKAIFTWTAGGREEPDLRVIDIDTGEALVDGVPHRKPQNFAWLPDSSGFIYLALDAALAGEPSLYRVDLGDPSAVRAEDVRVDHPVARPILCADRRHIVLAVDHLAPRLDYILDTQSNAGWQPFLKGVPGIFRGDILGDNFLAITDDGAPRGRLVAIPLATPTQRETWKEIIPPSDNVLAFVMVTGDRAVLLDWVDTYSRLRVIGWTGEIEGEITLPAHGMVNSFGTNMVLPTMIDPMARGADGEVLFIFSAFGQSAALYGANLDTHRARQLTAPRATLDVQTLDLEASSADGARVLYHVVARAGLDLTKPQPTVITGYGGFNVSVAPGWMGAQWAAWMAAGGVVALAHLRGGGEHGTPWFEQGRMKLKQNSFNDVHAIAEDLIARGISASDRIGVTGGSNGGVMASAVAVQRPDLYRASVPVVPITDVLGRVRDPVTMVSSLDYGDPADPVMAEVINSWSPYQNIRDSIAYPALLIDCGANDPRCPPWHGRKFAARVQQATTGDWPVLLRVRADAGHGSVGRAQKERMSADILAFFAHQLGLENDTGR